MPNRFLLSLAGVTLLSAGSSLAQAPPAAPLPPAPPPIQTIPTPEPTAPANLPSRGGYEQKPVPGSVQTVPVPVETQQPVIMPGQTTAAAPYPAYVPYGTPDEDKPHETNGSTYIPVDSWVYPAMTRLYSLGYVDTMFLAMRPWTRQSTLHMLEASEDEIRDSNSEEAKEILVAMKRELRLESPNNGTTGRGTIYGTDSAYTRLMGISGTTLRDSYHLGQTIVNDYGRPYQPGFNSLFGASTIAEYGRLSLYVRGEYQHAPAADGYNQTLSAQLSQGVPKLGTNGDYIDFSGYNRHQATIPSGPISAQNPFRLVEATLSFHLLGHEISGGKSDAWLGPAQGGALAWSNNAENIYSFRINRVEPLHIPLVSYILGPMRYDFFYGSLKGHTAPNHPYTHSEIFSFEPTKNFQFAFQRTIVFGGAGHSPVTLRTFVKGFFNINDTTGDVKAGRNDPGARFSDFSASYRLPFLRKYTTFYVDSIAHDDVTPISAPRRAAYRTGLYISQFPGLRKLDFRVEAASTDPGVAPSHGGYFNYYETIQRQAYTNKGFIMGDWIGREAKGGQAWLTYHLSGNEMIQVEYLNKKNPKDFILGAYNPATNTYGPGGTTQNSFKANVVKRFHHEDIELNAWVQMETWKAPAYLTGQQRDFTSAFQLTWFPGLKSTAAVK